MCLQCLRVCGKWKPYLPQCSLNYYSNLRDIENREDIHNLILYENPEVPRLFKFSLKENLISGPNYLVPKKIKALNFLPLQVDFGRKEYTVHYFSTFYVLGGSGVVADSIVLL